MKWALPGDSNTKYFHTISSSRRNQNAIRSLADAEGNCYEDESALKDLGKSHFACIYKDDGGTCLVQQLKVVMIFPKMISNKQATNLTCPVTLWEIEFALKSFKKYCSPSPNGWPVEFYLHFFDLLGLELLFAVDSTRFLDLFLHL